MTRTSRLGAACVAAVLAALAASASAAAASAPISGKLNVPGYTVIGLAADGTAATAFAPAGAFTLAPPADTVTLHLRRPDGTYGGPVVVEEPSAGVAEAKAAVASARKKLTRAKRKVRAARKKLRRADGRRAQRKAKRRLRRAKRQRRAARRALVAAKGTLAEAKRESAVRPGRAILGVKAGASVGDVVVAPGAGIGLARGLTEADDEKWVDPTRQAMATRGIPIGAGNYGFVASQASAVPGDLDRDGIPDPLDVDDDGDLVLDNFERGSAARVVKAAQSGDGCQAPCTPDVVVASGLVVRLEETANANAGALSVQDLDAALSAFGELRIGFPRNAETELDCRGLSYCSPGGTGRAGFFGPPGDDSTAPFPACCDPDGDGFGTMNQLSAFDPNGQSNQFFLLHGATTHEIGTGDVLIERATHSGGVETEHPITVQQIFATVPALISYSDGAGNSATVSYPLPPPYTGSPGSSTPGEGPREGFPVGAGPGGDVVLTFTFWRPQREAIAGEPGEWTDIGGLFYFAILGCPPSTLSTTDSDLAPVNHPAGGGGFLDQAPDQPASPENTLTFSLNVTQCLAARGQAWNPGESLEIGLVATNSGEDHAAQRLSFTREP